MTDPSIPPFHPHRRTFLKWMHAGLLSAPTWSLLGCGNSSLDELYPSLPYSSNWTPSSVLPKLEEDDMIPWWMKGNYGPLEDEVETTQLEVIGSLPPELNGYFIRNGPNPREHTPSFWFFGEGMLHQFHFENGQALSYKSRWTKTPSFNSDQPTLLADQANTNILYHADRLWTLYEISPPFEVHPQTLESMGFETFQDQLKIPMCAHPKVDPQTGEVWFIGVNQVPPSLGYGVLDKDGNWVKGGEIDVEEISLMHDVQLTENYLVIFDFPMYFDPAILSGGNLFKWDPEGPSRIGLLSRDEGTLTWYDVDPCYVFHTFNAYEKDQQIIIEGCRVKPQSSEDFFTASASPILWQWTLDLNTQSTSEGRRQESIFSDFPMIDLRYQSQENRYNFGLSLTPSSDHYPIHPTGIYTLHRPSNTLDQWTLGESLQLDEPYFVPLNPTSSEGEGWLLSVAFNRATQKSEVLVFEALNLKKGPIARVLLPNRVPFGFHGTWVPTLRS